MMWSATDVTQWRRVFAWLPVEIDGCWVWLQWVEKRAKGWHPDIGEHGEEWRLR